MSTSHFCMTLFYCLEIELELVLASKKFGYVWSLIPVWEVPRTVECLKNFAHVFMKPAAQLARATQRSSHDGSHGKMDGTGNDVHRLPCHRSQRQLGGPDRGQLSLNYGNINSKKGVHNL